MGVKTISVKDGGFIDLGDFADIIDVEKVYSYTLKQNKDKTITVKLYDKKGKLVKPNVR